jgi:hypothetical protein
LNWCEGTGEQIQVTTAVTTRATSLFEPYAECALAAGVYSCADYCVDAQTLAKFHCSLHQPGAVRLARRDYVDCKARGYAGCANGACVTKMPAAPSPKGSPSPLPRERCEQVQALSAAAPSQITGERSDGSTFAFTDYCADARTLVHYSCAGGSYRAEARACGSGSECAGGACVPASVVTPPKRESGSGAWLAYGVVGVFLVACGVALWMYVSGEEAREARSRKKRGDEREQRAGARRAPPRKK